MKLQISPLSGTYQIILASPYWSLVADETQPLMSVRAVARPMRLTRMDTVKAFMMKINEWNVQRTKGIWLTGK
jgi:hypothetical protein